MKDRTVQERKGWEEKFLTHESDKDLLRREILEGTKRRAELEELIDRQQLRIQELESRLEEKSEEIKRQEEALLSYKADMGRLQSELAGSFRIRGELEDLSGRQQMSIQELTNKLADKEEEASAFMENY